MGRPSAPASKARLPRCRNASRAPRDRKHQGRRRRTRPIEGDASSGPTGWSGSRRAPRPEPLRRRGRLRPPSTPGPLQAATRWLWDGDRLPDKALQCLRSATGGDGNSRVSSSTIGAITTSWWASNRVNDIQPKPDLPLCAGMDCPGVRQVAYQLRNGSSLGAQISPRPPGGILVHPSPSACPRTGQDRRLAWGVTSTGPSTQD